MIIDQLRDIFTQLNTREVRYVVVGGWAVGVHGHPRATHDLDLVVALDPANALSAVRSLQDIGLQPTLPVPAEQFADPARREFWAKERNMLVFQMRTGNPLDVPVDLFITEPFDFERAHAEAKHTDFFGVSAPVVPLDMLIEMKERSDRVKDQEDVRILRELSIEPPDV